MPLDESLLQKSRELIAQSEREIKSQVRTLRGGDRRLEHARVAEHLMSDLSDPDQHDSLELLSDSEPGTTVRNEALGNVVSHILAVVGARGDQDDEDFIDWVAHDLYEAINDERGAATFVTHLKEALTVMIEVKKRFGDEFQSIDFGHGYKHLTLLNEIMMLQDDGIAGNGLEVAALATMAESLTDVDVIGGQARARALSELFIETAQHMLEQSRWAKSERKALRAGQLMRTGKILERVINGGEGMGQEDLMRDLAYWQAL
jgi:hypothetical protein